MEDDASETLNPVERQQLFDIFDEDEDIHEIIKRKSNTSNAERQWVFSQFSKRFEELTGRTLSIKQIRRSYHNRMERMRGKRLPYKTGFKLDAGERQKLFDIINEDSTIGKIIHQTGKYQKREKHEAWLKITNRMIEMTGKPVSFRQLQKIYHNHKDNLKKKQIHGAKKRGRPRGSKKRKGHESRSNEGLPMEVKWVSHETSLAEAFQEMRDLEEHFDVTLSCKNKYQVKAHKLILSACSNFFRQEFKNNLNSKGHIHLANLSPKELDGILDYMYTGKAMIPQKELAHFLEVARHLEIKGLATELLQPEKREEHATCSFKIESEDFQAEDCGPKNENDEFVRNEATNSQVMVNDTASGHTNSPHGQLLDSFDTCQVAVNQSHLPEEKKTNVNGTNFIAQPNSSNNFHLRNRGLPNVQNVASHPATLPQHGHSRDQSGLLPPR